MFKCGCGDQRISKLDAVRPGESRQLIGGEVCRRRFDRQDRETCEQG
jgi:hypothetical protein